MKKNLHDIDKLFKAALEEHEESPGESVWDAIDQQLDKNKVIDINRKYVRLRKIAVILAVVLMGVGAYTLSTWGKFNELAGNKKESVKDNNHTSKNQIADSIKPAAEKGRAATDATIADTVTARHLTIDGDAELNTRQNNKNNIPGIDKKKKKDSTTQHPVQQNMTNTGADNMADNARNADATQKLKKANQPPVNKISNDTQETAQNQLVQMPRVVINKKKQKTTTAGGDISEDDNSTTANSKVADNTIGVSIRALPLANVSVLDADAMKNNNGVNQPVANNKAKAMIGNLKLARMNKGVNLKGFSATIFYGPDLISNRVKEEKHERRPGGQPVEHADKDEINEQENHKTSQSFGLLIDYKLSNHWSLQSGLAVINKTINIEPKKIYARPDYNGSVKYLFDCSSGYSFLSSKNMTAPAVGDSLTAFESVSKLQYLSVPLVAKYNFVAGRFELYAGIGASINFLKKGEIKTQLGSSTYQKVAVNNDLSGAKSSYFTGNLGAGAYYNISDRIAFGFMPSYNFALTSSTKDAAVKSFPNSMNLAGGIRFKL